MAVPTTRQILQQLIDELPEDATIADVQYRLHVIEAGNRGRADIDSGRVVPHEQAMARLRARDFETWRSERARRGE